MNPSQVPGVSLTSCHTDSLLLLLLLRMLLENGIEKSLFSALLRIMGKAPDFQDYYGLNSWKIAGL